MATPKVMTGARAKVYIGKNGETPVLVGIFSNISYSESLDAQGAWILGRYAAAEIDYTAAELVNITATGWRVVGQGVHKGPAMPLLQQLISYGYLTLTIEDRATKKTVAQIEYVRPTGQNGGFSARQLSEVSLNMVGILLSDEDGTQAFLEDGTASDIPG
jgi:hypothetical protein